MTLDASEEQGRTLTPSAIFAAEISTCDITTPVNLRQRVLLRPHV